MLPATTSHARRRRPPPTRAAGNHLPCAAGDHLARAAGYLLRAAPPPSPRCSRRRPGSRCPRAAGDHLLQAPWRTASHAHCWQPPHPRHTIPADPSSYRSQPPSVRRRSSSPTYPWSPPRPPPVRLPVNTSPPATDHRGLLGSTVGDEQLAHPLSSARRRSALPHFPDVPLSLLPSCHRRPGFFFGRSDVSVQRSTIFDSRQYKAVA
nr:uncharacterized protein LOC127345217 isoform X2 [Lolium perenne]